MSLTRTCRISGKEFAISDQEIALLDKLSPIIGGEKFSIPLPTLCPEERRRRRLCYKNFFSLHYRNSSKSGKKIISIYPEEYSGSVYSQDEWWGDSWEHTAYTQDFSKERSFFEQWKKLFETCPQMCLENTYTLCENSEYINGNGQSKDCYLVSNGNNNEKCLYAYHLFGSSNILNVTYCRFSENCSFSSHLWKCYNVHYSFDAPECRDCWYIFSCTGSHNLIGCVGRENQSYQILNTPVSPEEFDITLDRLKTDQNFHSIFLAKLKKLIETVRIEKHILTGSVNSTGDFCYDSKNCYECYCTADSENSIYIYDSYNIYDSMDIDGWGDNIALSYDSIAVGQNITNIYWCYGVTNSRYMFYSWQCDNCSNCFGCFGLRFCEYYIFNKPYTKEAWEKKVSEIITFMKKTGEWGEYMGAEYSPFAYNECHANIVFPLAQDDVEKRGLKWAERESTLEDVTRTIPAKRLPFDIRAIPDDVLHWAILCEKSGKPYKIQKMELEMYRRLGLSIPHLHPTERIQKLFEWDQREFSFDF